MLRAAVMLFLAVAGAARAEASDPPADVVFAPLAHEERSFAKMGPVGSYWPSAAGKRAGEVIMDCLVGAGGVLDDCQLIRETPAKRDFWPAAARMAGKRRVLASANAVGGARAVVRVPFTPGGPVEVLP